MRILNFLIPGVLLLPGLYSCRHTGGGASESNVEYADTLTHHSRYLTVSDIGGGNVLVDIADPWADGAYLGRYLLVHRDSAVAEDVPAGATVVRVPLQRMAVFSSVHTQGIVELGAADAICAVADAAYFADSDTVAAMLREGSIADIGSSQSPSAERIAAARTEAILRSPMQGVAAPILPPGVADIVMADYLEPTPIGRAEWIILLGELTGTRDRVRAVFTDVIDEYSSLVFKVGRSELPAPKVLTETEQAGVWYVPAGKSYMARMIADAGGKYLWADTEGTGSLPLSFEKVAERGLDADVWLIRSFGFTPTPSSLTVSDRRYAAFRPVKYGTVYGCDTSVKPIFNDIAFHPEYVLADYVAIFHPDVMPGYELKYFSK